MNVSLRSWIETHSLNSFRFLSLTHVVSDKINDVINLSYFDSTVVESFNSLIGKFDAEFLVLDATGRWTYTNDREGWDVANPPVKSFLTGKGDCDDYARLVAYILHRKLNEGYTHVYYTALNSENSGHVTITYFNSNTNSIGLIDVNGYWVEFEVSQFAVSELALLVKYVFPDTVNVDIRTWDTTKSVLTTNVKKERPTDARFF